jgi:ABC-type antimicrobial peptide transport system permease subunit
MSVMSRSAAIAAAGGIAGAVSAFVLARLAGSYFQVVRMPGAVPMVASAAVLVVALVASMLPAPRAARVDVIQALRSE